MNVLDLAMTHGLAPKRVSSAKGGEFASSCPFCGGDDRFRIWPDQNSGNGSYWCRQCSKHGDRIQFVMDTKNIKFLEACQITGDTPADKSTKFVRSGFKGTPVIPVSKPESTYAPKKPAPSAEIADPVLWAEHSAKLVSWAANRLSGSPGEMVLRKKGITQDTAAKYRIGWISEDIYRTRESWGLPTIMSEKTGKPKRLWFPAGLVIPHSIKFPDNSEKYDRIRIRRIEGEPRYYIIPGSSPAQLIVGQDNRCAVVVESELDAILLDQIIGDFTRIIAIGTSHAKPDTGASEVLSKASRILIALDNDDAGIKASAWWCEKYEKAILHQVPSGKDPSDAISYGVNLREWAISGWPAGWKIPVYRPQPSISRHRENDSINDSQLSGNTPAPITGLYELMRKNRQITITVTANSLALSAPKEWKSRNEQTFSAISRLVYFDPVVFAWLHDHGANKITAQNLLEARS
jgi:hypothetical protein